MGEGDKRLLTEMLEGLQRAFGIDPALPFGKLPRKLRDIVLTGAPGKRSKSGKDVFGTDFEGVLPNLRRRFDEGIMDRPGALEPYRALRPVSPAKASGCARRAARCE